MPSIEELRPQIESKLAESGCVLFDIRYFRAGPRSILRINVDKPNGGITIGECEEVSNELSILLDVEGFSLNRPYTLEVSSPGSDRLLKTEQDYRRIINRYVVIHLKNEIDGNKKVRGKVLGCENNIVTIQTEHTTLEIPLNTIHSGKEEIRFK